MSGGTRAAAAMAVLVVAVAATVLLWKSEEPSPLPSVPAGVTEIPQATATPAARTPPPSHAPADFPPSDSTPDRPTASVAEAPSAVRRSNRELLLKISNSRDACAVLGSIGPGWGPRQPGLDRLRDAFGEWIEILGEGPHPWKGPALLAKANIEHAVGEEKAALDTFIEALLAMDREGPQPPWGLPRLYHFADAPNTAPTSEEERKQWREADDVRSGGWAFMGGSPLILYGEEGKAFGKWLVKIANDGRTDAAAAASIWLHAVAASNWGVEGFTPPAAVELLLRRRPGGDLSPRGSALWWQGFNLALEEAVRDDEPVALDLRDERARTTTWIQREREAQRPRSISNWSECVWSLRHEMRTRFAELETPRGKALRALAERLVTWD